MAFPASCQEGAGAACTEVHILHLNGSLSASLGRGCREYPVPEYSQSTSEPGGKGKKRQHVGNRVPVEIITGPISK